MIIIVRGSFRRTAGQLFKEYKFVEVLVDNEQDEVLQKNDVSYDSIKIFKTIGEEVSEAYYPEQMITRKRITNWIDQNAPWDVHEITTGSAFSDAKNFFREYPILTVYLDYNNEELKQQIISSLETVAEDFREKIVFTYMNGFVVFSYSFAFISHLPSWIEMKKNINLSSNDGDLMVICLS